jgi:hypothetical protein
MSWSRRGYKKDRGVFEMSGGHWDYSQFTIEEKLREVGEDEEVAKRFPPTAKIFLEFGELLGKTVHALDWDLSGDSSVEHDELFSYDFIRKLKKIINDTD